MTGGFSADEVLILRSMVRALLVDLEQATDLARNLHESLDQAVMAAEVVAEAEGETVRNIYSGGTVDPAVTRW